MKYVKSLRTLIVLCIVTFFLIIGMTAIFGQVYYVIPDDPILYNTDLLGSDYRSFEMSPLAPSAPPGEPSLGYSFEERCRDACHEDIHCQAWTCGKQPAGIWNAKVRCWLKNAIPKAIPNNLYTSGVISREFEPNTDRPGYDYKVTPIVFSQKMRVTDIPSINNLQSSICYSNCKKDSNCLAWTYDNMIFRGSGGIHRPSEIIRPTISNGICHLKNKIPAANTNTSSISGVKGQRYVIR